MLKPLLRHYGYLQTIQLGHANVIAEAVGQAAARLAEQLQAAAIITLTDSGFTARLISKHRPESSIIAVTPSPQVARRLALNWGVIACCAALQRLAPTMPAPTLAAGAPWSWVI